MEAPLTTRIDYGAGRAALEAQREHTRDVCDIEPLVPVDEFRANCELAKVGSTLFILTRTASVSYLRRPVHLARGGDDHYQIQLQLEGRRAGSVGPLQQGDVGFHATGRPSVTELHAPAPACPARVLVWMVPRIMLAPLLPAADDAHGTRFTASAPYTRLLGDCLWSVWENASRCTEREGEAAAYSLLLLLAAGLGQGQGDVAPERGGERVSRAARAAQLATIKRYLETQLEAELDPAAVMQRFGLSRASLYRLFAPEGGLASYVRSRRLHRAARLLISPAHRHLRIVDIALESHFASETSFLRAFRREHGISPAELRASINAHGISRPPATVPLDWLRQVGGAFPLGSRPA
jgi:AraC-like DNA-binding protein